MNNDTRDTQPAPSHGVPTEMVEAAADDIRDAIEAMRLQVRNLEAIETLLRREATDAR